MFSAMGKVQQVMGEWALREETGRWFIEHSCRRRPREEGRNEQRLKETEGLSQVSIWVGGTYQVKGITGTCLARSINRKKPG